jgi:hypothetical protein
LPEPGGGLITCPKAAAAGDRPAACMYGANCRFATCREHWADLILKRKTAAAATEAATSDATPTDGQPATKGCASASIHFVISNVTTEQDFLTCRETFVVPNRPGSACAERPRAARICPCCSLGMAMLILMISRLGMTPWSRCVLSAAWSHTFRVPRRFAGVRRRRRRQQQQQQRMVMMRRPNRPGS